MSPELARNSMADLGDVWPPGFRFHPTDEELILYYLKRKICHRKLRLDVIAEVDVYKWDPEDLPALSLVNNGERQWFFFSPRDRKYPNGSRANRATEHGYWKATGKDRTISCNSRTVGLKKTLVFYKGRASSGERTDWVMHEYTLEESELRRCQDVQDYYVLYKVFKKSGPGPKNGELYGAPFKEEDWVDDELPAVSNCDNSNNNVKQSNGIASVYMYNDKTQEQCTWDDIEEFLNQFVDSPPEGPDINDYQCAIPQVLGQEAHSTMADPSLGKTTYVDSCRMQLLQGQQNVDVSMNFSLLSSSQGKLHDASKVASTGLTNLEQYLLEEDFLEMDDLLGPDAKDDVGGFIPQPACGEPTIDSQWGEVDGLSELDLYFDVETFLHDLRPINQATASHSFPDHQATQLGSLDDMEGKQPSNAMDIGIQQGTYDQNCFFPILEESNQETTPLPTTGDICAGNFTPKAMESISNRSGKGVEGNDKWYSSAMWSFVESIPTTPASASESALVNRAFERMSGFTRLRLIPKSTTGGSTGGRMKGFFLFPYIRAFFAVLFVLISSFGKIRYLFNILNN